MKSFKAKFRFGMMVSVIFASRLVWPASIRHSYAVGGLQSWLLAGHRRGMVIHYCPLTGTASSRMPLPAPCPRRSRRLLAQTTASSSGSLTTSHGATRRLPRIRHLSFDRQLELDVPTQPCKRSRKKIIGARRVARASQQRSSQTFLQAQRVRPATRQLYAKAVAEFEVWAAHHRRRINDQFVDKTLNAYMHDLFFRGESPYAARMALYGLIHMRTLSRGAAVLPLSKAGYLGYVKAAPELQRDPTT